MKKIVLFLTLIYGLVSLQAQTLPYTYEYHFNKYLLNPAAAGYNFQGLSFRLTDRHQWIGIPGAPQTQTFTFTNIVGGNHGIGIMLGRDKIGLQQRLAGQASYSFHSMVDRVNNRHLAFGIAAQVFQYTFTPAFSNPVAQMDRAFVNAITTKIFPNAALGALFYGDKGFFGISAFNLIKPQITSDFEPTTGYVTIGRKEKIKRNLFLELSYLLKIDGNFNYEMDVNAFLSFGSDFWIGTSYRTPSALLLLTGLNKGHLSFGYAFEYSFASVMLSSYGTHSVMLGYNIANQKPKRTAIQCPAYF